MGPVGHVGSVSHVGPFGCVASSSHVGLFGRVEPCDCVSPQGLLAVWDRLAI